MKTILDKLKKATKISSQKPDNKVLSSPCGTVSLFNDGSTSVFNASTNDVTFEPAHPSVGRVMLDTFNDDRILVFQVKPSELESTLGFSLEIFPNGVSRTRMPNPHDGVDDVWINNAENTAKEVSKYLKMDISLICGVLNEPDDVPQNRFQRKM
jgi:hypothetical protein